MISCNTLSDKLFPVRNIRHSGFVFPSEEYYGNLLGETRRGVCDFHRTKLREKEVCDQKLMKDGRKNCGIKCIIWRVC
jgi:hypothetical protein